MTPKYMMATKAFHKLGDISSEHPDICYVERSTRWHYIGHWIFGLGFINVKFPKKTTRDLTEQERAIYMNTYVQVGSQPPQRVINS